MPQRQAQESSRRWRVGNIPVPESHLIGIAAAVGLHRLRPAAVRATAARRSVIGLTLIAAATVLISRSLTVAGQVDLDRPRVLLTTGPYAISRNPMYVGWAMIHLGIGVLAGSAWTGLSLPLALAWIHREVRHEERRLAAVFGQEFTAYRAAVPRYLPRWRPFRTGG